MRSAVAPQGEGKRPWRYSRVGSIVASADFYIGLPLGLACGLLPVFSNAVSNNTQTVLLGVAAIAGALVALVLTAVTVLVAVITPTFGRFLDRTPQGLPGIMRPYQWVIAVCAASCALAVVAALAWPLVQSFWALRFLGVALPVGLLLWGLGGCLQIIGLTAKTINQSRQVEQLEERARMLRRA